MCLELGLAATLTCMTSEWVDSDPGTDIFKKATVTFLPSFHVFLQFFSYFCIVLVCLGVIKDYYYLDF